MPKEQDVEDMDADSSAATADEASTTEKVEGEQPAESSAATDETEADTLSVVRDVVESRESEPAEAAPSAEGEEGEGADETAQGEQDDEDYSDVPFSKHPRFRKLVAEKNAFKQDAARYRNVEAFLDQANLDPEEAANVMTIAGLAKTDAVAAWAQIKPWVQNLLVAAGEVLPQDLAERVKKGEISQELALEQSRIRARDASRESVAKFNRERGERQQQAEVGQRLMQTAEDWLTNRRLKDPNFASKEARLGERIAYLQRIEGRPNTPDGVKAQLKKAYDAVNKEVGTPAARPAAKPAVPQRKPAIRPIQGGTVAANGASAAPTSTIDVIRRVREQRATA